MQGKIVEIFGNENGYILGADDIHYLYHILDFVQKEDIKINQIVTFKPNKIEVKKTDIYYATLIQVEKEKSLKKEEE